MREIIRTLIVSIDGPSGSGKTTTARLLARRLGLVHIDTGAMYRAVTLQALRHNVDPGDGEKLGELARECRIDFAGSSREEPRVLLNGEDVTVEIRAPEVTGNVSLVSSHPQVRRVMAIHQRLIADSGGVVLEGRDIGTVILPWAHVKIFLVASLDVRAKRRQLEMRSMGIERSFEETRREIEERDRYDSTRSMSPLKKPIGAVEVDTTTLTIDEQVDRIVTVVEDIAQRLMEMKRSGDRRPLKIRFYFRAGQFLIRNACRLLFGLEIHKNEELKYAENYIFACNHMSNADPPLIGSTLPRELHFMAKEELFRFKPLAWLITKYNAIPLKRGAFDKDALEKALELLRAGGSMMIFPEGTRQRGGRLGKPKSGVGYLAVNSGVAVVPVFAEGTDKLPKALVRRAPLRVVIGRPIRFTELDSSRFRNSRSYQEFSEMVMEAIGALRDCLPLSRT